MFDSVIAGGLDVGGALLCFGVSIGAGLLIAFAYSLKSPYTKNFLITLILLPAIVQTVIMMVNGNIGTGVAVLGAFSLIRFRSVPGNSKEICSIFFAMAVGIATGIGQVWFAIVFTAIVCAVFVALKFAPVGRKKAALERTLKITVPEDLDFERELKEIIDRHTRFANMSKIKTSQMGSLYVLEYRVRLTRRGGEKQLIDDLRVKNGNLPIVCNAYVNESDDL